MTETKRVLIWIDMPENALGESDLSILLCSHLMDGMISVFDFLSKERHQENKHAEY